VKVVAIPCLIIIQTLFTTVSKATCRPKFYSGYQYFNSIRFAAGAGFEKTFARKLQPTDYYFNPQIGFISLNQQLQPDEVLAVAFEYTYNGKLHRVGEFSQDFPPDSTGNTQKVLFLKLLKATSQRPSLPIWDLMMKMCTQWDMASWTEKIFSLMFCMRNQVLVKKDTCPLTGDPTVQRATTSFSVKS
jgi:cell surface protein SprA